MRYDLPGNTILPNGVRGYETCSAQCNVAYGTDENLAEALVDMLDKLHK